MLRKSNANRGIAPVIGRAVVVLSFAAGAVWTLFASETQGARFHRDAQAVEEASLAMSRALILEDMQAARKALGALAEASPPLGPEDREIYGQPIYDAERALQQTLARAREFAALDNVQRAFDEFIWVRRTCLNCHQVGREEGRLPASGPLRPATP